MRIDGTVKNEKRHECVNYFQNSDECRIAILAITACATGLTLTKASTVVFAEMYFTPAILIQAEDRAHRIGQDHNCVNVHYLFGKETVDELIFPELEKKFSVVSNALDAKKMNLDVKNVLKGEKGEIKKRTIHSNKKDDNTSINQSSNLSNLSLSSNKGNILSYMVKKSDIKNKKSNDKDKDKENNKINNVNINMKKEFEKLDRIKSDNKDKDKEKDNSLININKIENDKEDSFDSLIEGIFNEDQDFVKEVMENDNDNLIKRKIDIDLDYNFNFDESDINLHKSSKKRTSEESNKEPKISNKSNKIIKDYFNKTLKQNHHFSTTDEFEENKKKKK